MFRKLLTLGFALLLALGAEGATAGEWVTVKRVNDGDTVQLADGRLVRYIGVNAPEIQHERNTAEPFGFEARARNIELVGARRIRLEFDLERFDDYGRALAYVFLPDGSMVNEKLLQSGTAYCLYRMPNVKYEARLLEAQREAMQDRRGMWREWREKEGRYMGNRNSRRFHAASCPEAKHISSRNRILFSKRWEAFWAGSAPSKDCLAEFSIPAE
ncbi:MAG: thermonuclease family protein [Deltaproteobacteria bacterium]|nr:thermonuclease family protein [Deltaproteobacteria bacterium]